MRFYRVNSTTEGGISAGYNWFTNQREADSFAVVWRRNNPEESATVEWFDITPTKAGLLDALRAFASHCDNG